MLKAVVFDMDETLLSINLSAFIAILIRDEAALLADIGRKNPLYTFTQLGGVLLDLNNNARPEDDSDTNLAFFQREVRRRCGVALDDPVIADAFAYYEREILPRKNDGIIAARPRPGAAEALEGVLARGLRIALLTNPCFTRECIACRMAWGRLEAYPFELITTLENTTRCKPSTRYYQESLDTLGLAPEEVLMVGNDPKRDFAAPELGLETAYVGSGRPARALWTGDMVAFAAHLDEIAERFEERAERRRAVAAQEADASSASASGVAR